MLKVGDMVAVNVDSPSQWGIIVQVANKNQPRGSLDQYVRVRWGWKSQWHNSCNLKIVSEAL